MMSGWANKGFQVVWIEGKSDRRVGSLHKIIICQTQRHPYHCSQYHSPSAGGDFVLSKWHLLELTIPDNWSKTLLSALSSALWIMDCSVSLENWPWGSSTVPSNRARSFLPWSPWHFLHAWASQCSGKTWRGASVDLWRSFSVALLAVLCALWILPASSFLNSVLSSQPRESAGICRCFFRLRCGLETLSGPQDGAIPGLISFVS